MLVEMDDAPGLTVEDQVDGLTGITHPAVDRLRVVEGRGALGVFGEGAPPLLPTPN